MAVTIDEITLDPKISYGARGGPMYRTTIVTADSGVEQRIGQWNNGLVRYDFSEGVKSLAQMDTLIAFFRARKGKLRGFRFKDWTDYKATNELLVNPYPATTTQLQKTYSDAYSTEIRAIKKPVASPVAIITENGVALVAGTNYTLDTTTGIVTFLGSKPVNGATYRWTGQFDVPVRFDTDQLSATITDATAREWNDLTVVEIVL